MNDVTIGADPSNPLLVHVHTPKAGGSTIAGILESIYRERLLVAHPLGDWPQQWPEEFIAHVEEKRNYYGAFSGHSAFGIHKLFRRKALYFSSVRDPIERFESYYNFVRHWSIHRYHEIAKNMTISEFFRYLHKNNDTELYNLQCLLLCGHKDFNIAREFILHNYVIVFSLKYIDDGFKLLGERLGWPSVEIPKLNVTEHKSKIDELTKEEFNTLYEGNSADRDLVKFCEDHMEALIKRN
jgi:hypothetical protein